LSQLSVVRVIRLARIVRLIRLMRFFSDLRVMVAGIMSSMMSLFWALVLLLIIMYIFSVFVLQMVVDEPAIKTQDEDSDLVKYYGNLVRSIFTLFQCICGGLDWGDPAAPLVEMHPIIGFMFAFYIAFAVFCVLNIITGVFVENTNKMAQKDEDNMILEEVEIKQEWANIVANLFNNADVDMSGEIDAEEFAAQADDLRVQAYFRRIGLEVNERNARGLFSLLDFDGDGMVTLDEFSSGLQQLHGTAKRMDVARIKHDVNKALRMMKEVSGGVAELMDTVDKGKSRQIFIGPNVHRANSRSTPTGSVEQSIDEV